MCHSSTKLINNPTMSLIDLSSKIENTAQTLPLFLYLDIKLYKHRAASGLWATSTTTNGFCERISSLPLKLHSNNPLTIASFLISKLIFSNSIHLKTPAIFLS